MGRWVAIGHKMEEHKYADIIHLGRPVSARRAPMPEAERAAQFSPFAALVGFEGMITETGRLTQTFVELTEDAWQEIDRELCRLAEHIREHPRVRLTWFCPDGKKAGGAYLETVDRVKKLDRDGIWLSDGTRIPMGHIRALAVEL